MWKKLRQFDYTNLSFLYVSCLVTIAFVFTVFRFSQAYLAKQEIRSLREIQAMEKQLELVRQFQHLMLATQNRPLSRDRDRIIKIVSSYEEMRQHQSEWVNGAKYFTVHGQQLQKSLSSAKGRSANVTLEKIHGASLKYQTALKEGLDSSFKAIYSRAQTTRTFETIAYLCMIALLVIQALYIFRPAIKRLNASLATRAEFLSRISHEIRNPMNSIIGMADILRGTRLNSEQQQYVENLMRSGQALLDMLNNLIDFSVIEGAKFTLKPAPFDLFSIFDRSLSLVAVQAHHKNIDLHLNFDAAIANHVVGDPVRLQQVLINLVNNAVKFTEQGSVTLDVALQSQTAESMKLLFSVEDTGIGVKESQLREIFDSFVQADSSIQRKYGGSGLGLSIASEIIKLMGGTLEVESTFGKGSRFFFTVELPKVARVDANPAPLTGLQSRHLVLAVADTEAKAYQQTMIRLNTDATICHTTQTLRAILQAPNVPPAEEILIDDSMGIISMINCRNVAAENGLEDRCVAMVRTNFAKENMDLLHRNGFSRCLIKPLRPWEILVLPKPIADAGDAQALAMDIVDQLKKRNLRLLLVDDSNDNLFLLKELVQSFASLIHFAENGEEAVTKFIENSYDVVLMDIQMPVMDGYTAIRKMREIERQQGSNQLPIFAVTAHSGLVDAQKCRDSGFTDRIVKPIVRNEIYRVLGKALNLDAEANSSMDDVGMPEKYRTKLLPIYLKTRFDDINKLRSALGQTDFQTISQLGHKIKGSAASYGFPLAHDISTNLEFAARAQDLDRCGELVTQLENIFQDQSQQIQV